MSRMKRRVNLHVFMALGAGLLICLYFVAQPSPCPVEVRFQGFTNVAGQQTRFAAFVATNHSRGRFSIEWISTVEGSKGTASAAMSAGRAVLHGRGAAEFWVLPPEGSLPWQLEATGTGHPGVMAGLRVRCATFCANLRWTRLADSIAPGKPPKFVLMPVDVPREP